MGEEKLYQRRDTLFFSMLLVLYYLTAKIVEPALYTD